MDQPVVPHANGADESAARVRGGIGNQSHSVPSGYFANFYVLNNLCKVGSWHEVLYCPFVLVSFPLKQGTRLPHHSHVPRKWSGSNYIFRTGLFEEIA